MSISWTAARIAVLLCAASMASAQKAIEVTSGEKGCQVINRTPFGVAMLLRGTTQDGSAMFETVTAPAKGSGRCTSASAEPQVLRLEVLTYLITTGIGTPEADVARLGTMTEEQLREFISSLEKQMTGMEVSSTAAAREQLEAVESVAKLKLAEWELEKRREQIDNLGQDEMDLQASLTAIDHGNYAAAGAMMDQQRQQQIEQTFESIGMAATVYGAVESAKRAQLADERDLLKKLLTSAEARRAELNKALIVAAAEAKAGEHYSDTVVQMFRSSSGQEIPSGTLRLVSPAQKTRLGISGKSDYVDVRLDAPAKLAVVFAEVKFDHGDGHRTLLRRVEGTDIFRGEIFWPVEAEQARVTVIHPVSGAPVGAAGSIATGRPSLTRAANEGTKALASVKKKYNETKARAEGSDQVRTLAIP